MIKRLLIICLLILTVPIIGCSDKKEDKASESTEIKIATGGTAGTYYPLGKSIAEILSNNGFNAEAQSTGGSVANINMLNEGSVNLAIVQNDIAFYAVKGSEMFASSPVTNLKAIASLYPETCQIITLEKTGINSVADFKGKRIAVGARGSGVEANARQIMSVYGIEYEDIDVKYLSFAQAVNAILNGEIDATFITAGYPTNAVEDIASKEKLKILSIDEDKINELTKKYPFYTQMKIPAGKYTGLDNDVTTVSVMAMLITTDDMSATDGEKITKTIFDNLDKLKTSHSVAEMISKSTAKKGLSIEMNPGAENYLGKSK